jgi:aldehyde dehydrogenase (NAD+)
MAWRDRLDHLFIGGEWVRSASADQIDVISPKTEAVIATVVGSAPSDVDRAAQAARQAFDHGPWPRMALSERMAVLQTLSDSLRDHHDEHADLITEEMGCPITQSRQIQVTAARGILDSALEIASGYPFQSIRRSATNHALVIREPVGVVAAVVPWNMPLATTMQKLAPALLTGCTMILKPAPETPLDAYMLAEVLTEAGLPEGVLNVLPADREVSEYLISHPLVDKVAFTGSTVAGRRIASLCGNDLRRVTLELGGKSAAVILDDADLDDTVERLRLLSMRNSGQVCSLKTRLLVSNRLEHEFIERLEDLLGSMPVGDPDDPSTQIGPMVSQRQRDRVEDYIKIGQDEGAKVVVGGARPTHLDRGWYVEPTLFTAVDPGMRIAQEEIFGPVLSVISYDTEAEAIDIANNSAYGLSGAVFTSDIEHGLAVARRIRTGTVELNGSTTGFQAPMGGFKASGIGRESGSEGFDAYVELKAVGLPMNFVGNTATDEEQSR